MNVIILSDGSSHSNDVSVTNRVDQYSADEKSDTVVRCARDIGVERACAVIWVVRSIM
jgi:hypothetical protein